MVWLSGLGGGQVTHGGGGSNKTGLSDLHSFSLLEEGGRKEGKFGFSYINIYMNIYCHSWTCLSRENQDWTL